MRQLYLKIPSSNKAKEDIDVIMQQAGFINVAIACSSRNAILRFLTKMFSVIMLLVRVKEGDVLLVQYPFKKYFSLVCRLTHMRGGKVITLIHDLGCFRRKKLTVEEEIKRLSFTDVLIVHNESMMQFLSDNGYKKPMITLGIFDYLSENNPVSLPEHKVSLPEHKNGAPWDVVYAGGLAERKNKFLYILDSALGKDINWTLHIHGNGLDETKSATWTHIKSRGFIKSDDFIRESVGHFGLVWDGAGINECSGDWGVYLKVNNPHKTSFYIRSGKPVIIWAQAALAAFVEREGIGITVNSLTDIDEKLHSLSDNDYEAMVSKTKVICDRLASGYYFNAAFKKAIELL